MRRVGSGALLRALAALIAAAFIALLGFGLAAQAPDTRGDEALGRGRAADAPAFELEMLQPGRPPDRLRGTIERITADGRVALSELRGTPVVLNFWASWCPPCRDEAPVLEEAWREAGRDGVVFLGLDTEDVRDDARGFLRKFRVSYLNVREGGKETSRRYGATGLPETFFITARGDIVAHVIGAVSAEQLRNGIAAARSGRPTPAITGGDRRSAP